MSCTPPSFVPRYLRRDQSINQSMNHSIKQSINQAIDQRINQSINRTNHWQLSNYQKASTKHIKNIYRPKIIPSGRNLLSVGHPVSHDPRYIVGSGPSGVFSSSGLIPLVLAELAASSALRGTFIRSCLHPCVVLTSSFADKFRRSLWSNNKKGNEMSNKYNAATWLIKQSMYHFNAHVRLEPKPRHEQPFDWLIDWLIDQLWRLQVARFNMPKNLCYTWNKFMNFKWFIRIFGFRFACNKARTICRTEIKDFYLFPRSEIDIQIIAEFGDKNSAIPIPKTWPTSVWIQRRNWPHFWRKKTILSLSFLPQHATYLGTRSS